MMRDKERLNLCLSRLHLVDLEGDHACDLREMKI